MAAPTAAVDTAAPLPPPPSTEPAATAVPDQKVAHPPPPVPLPDAAPPAPAPASAPAPAPAPRKRKLEDMGFHNSDYYKIRSVVAGLRVPLIQVSQATDSRNSYAAREILKEISVVMELSKKMRLNLVAISAPVKPSQKPPAVSVKDEPVKPAGPVKDEPVKPSEVPSAGGPVKDEPVKPSEEPSAGPVKHGAMKPLEEPSAGLVKDEPMKPSEVPSARAVMEETARLSAPVENNQAPQVGQPAIPPGFESAGAPTKHDSSQSAAVRKE